VEISPNYIFVYIFFSAYKVAGETTDFVNRVLCKVEEGDNSGGLEQS
jgi:hypothetical protein